ncbi:MAG: AMP-binding protein [Puniceicoccales bacterium]|jgi:acyl-CoA synthetase (AMP-forming)/AMP-acid ligase II|nr:AMP-binding protein [Puniceicoccales bacterium]
MNIKDAIEKVAAKGPLHPAIKIPQRCGLHNVHYKTISFEALRDCVGRLSTYLFCQSIARGDRVLVMVPPGEDLLVLIFSLLSIEAIPVIIDPGMGVRNFLNCAKKTQPSVWVGCPKVRCLSPFLSLKVRTLRKKIILTRSLKKQLEAKGFICNLQKNCNLDNPAAILFTSGSTGYPKGALYTYRQLNAQVEALQKAFNFQPGEVDLPLLPVFSLFNPLLKMTTVVPEMDPSHPSALNPAYIVETIHRCHVTNSFGSPRLWTCIADYCESKQIMLPSLKRVFLAGAPVHPLLLKRVQDLLPSGEVYTPYGATEALPIACISAKEVMEETCAQTLRGRGTCVGFPLSNVRIRIIPITELSLTTLPDPLPIYGIGEIIVQTSYASEAYANDLPATEKAKIVADDVVWHRMGDLGYLDEKGRLWFCGRKAECVITRSGKTYYTECCEAIFNACPEVFRSALIGCRQGSTTSPAMVIEPKIMPMRRKDKEILLDRVRQWSKQCAFTCDIEKFFLHKNFPVDVRHNAKIHRLKLAHYFQKF